MDNLTLGALSKILNGAAIESAVLQILDYKKVSSGEKNRFLLLLYDGLTRFKSAILATNLNYLIETNKLEKHSIFKLNSYACKELFNARKFIICLDIEVLMPGTKVKQQVSALNINENFPQPCTSSSEIFINNSNYNEKDAVLGGNSPENLSFNKSTSLYTKLCKNNSGNSEKDLLLGKSTLENLPYKQNLDCKSEENIIKSEADDKLFIKSSNCRENDTFLGGSSSGNLSFNEGASSYNKLCMNNFGRSEKDILLAKSTLENLSYKQNFDSHKSGKNAKIKSEVNDKLIIPISNLTPYHSKWTIKARIVYKTNLINYANQRRNGKFISFVLLDQTGEIRATAFDDYSVELHSLLEINKIYYISNAVVKIARENSCTNHEYEIILLRNSNIEQVMSDDLTVPMLSFNFTPIKEIESCTKDSVVDVIGICFKVSEIEAISTKNGKEICKRNIQLVDMSGSIVTVTLWGAEAENFKRISKLVIAVRNAKVRDFGGLSLNVSPSSMIFIDPSIKEAQNLKLWTKNLNDSIKFQPVSSFSEFMSWKTFAEVSDENLHCINKSIYYTIKATVIEVQKEKCLYQACPVADCYKKVINLNNALYKCDNCNKTYAAFSWMLFLPLRLADFSESLWATAFEEKAECMIKLKSEELNKIRETDEDKYYNTLSDLHFKSFIFKLCSKFETYKETNRMRTVITDVNMVEPLMYSKKLISDIKRLEKML